MEKRLHVNLKQDMYYFTPHYYIKEIEEEREESGVLYSNIRIEKSLPKTLYWKGAS